MNERETSPTWEVKKDPTTGLYLIFLDGNEIASVKNEAHANFIVGSCNYRPKMVTSLRVMIHLLDGLSDDKSRRTAMEATSTAGRLLRELNQ